MDPTESSRGFREFRRESGAFDGLSYLWLHEDVRLELGHDPDGAYRHWWFTGHAQDRHPPGLARTRPRRCDPARFRARPFGLNVFGPFDAVSGLGTAARNLVAAIAAADIPHALHPFDVAGGSARVTAGEAARAPLYRCNLVLANADQLRHVTSLYPPDIFDDAWTVAVWAWELAAFRPEWRAAAALLDEVWTNSRFELAALAAASLPVPLRLMPLPVPPPGWTDAERDRGRRLFGIGPDTFAVLCPFDAGSTAARKNPWAAIRAFRAAFADDPSVLLLLKHHGADPALRRALEHARGGGPNIRAIGALLPAGDMRLLQAASDALLSPHRAEGFGLNVAEMLAGGRAAIATDYSGTRDFLGPETGFPVPYRLATVGERVGPYLADAVWAEPDEAAMAAALLAARADGGARAARGARRIARDFAPALIGARIRRRLEALGLDRADGTIPPGTCGSVEASREPIVRPPPPAASPVAWPARLPLFTVLVDADDPVHPDRLAALGAQRYPFWEALLYRRAPWPAPVDVAARSAARGLDLRVRLAPSRDRDALLALAAGAFVLPSGVEQPLTPDALFDAARLLDMPHPPDAIALEGTTQVPIRIERKAALLRPWQRAAAGARVPAASDGVVAVLATEPALLDALPPDASLRSVLPAPTDAGPTALAAAALRTRSAERVLILSGPMPPLPPDWLARCVQALEPGGVGAVVPEAEALAAAAGDPGWPTLLFTTRATLRRLVALPVERRADGLRHALAALRLALAPVPGLPAAPTIAPARDSAFVPIAGSAAHRATVAGSFLLDAAFYRRAVPGIADVVAHWCTDGWRSGRAPNFYFDPAWYRARHMAAADAELDPLLHWMRHRRSGVRPSPAFDPAHVRAAMHLAPELDPLAVFLAQRHDGPVAPVPGFDPVFYRRRRPDLLYQRADPFEHYVRHGARERADPSAGFETAYYGAREIGWSPVPLSPWERNPLLHWLAHRDVPEVATSWRAALHREVARRAGDGRDGEAVPTLPLGFAWFDGLPQSVEALRAFLADRSIAATFFPVLGNASLAAAPRLPPSRRTLLLAPLHDPADDPDIAARFAECFADDRARRVDGKPLLGLALGAEPALARAFGARVLRRLAAEHAIDAVLEPFDGPPIW